MIKMRISPPYNFHLLAFGISITLAVASMSHLLFNDLSLMPVYRDIQSPKNKDFYTEQMTHLWTQYGSVPAGYEFVARSWSLWPLLFFSTNVASFTRLYFLVGYVLLFFIPYLSFFYLSQKLKLTISKAFLVASITAFIYSFNPLTLQTYSSPPTTNTYVYSLLPMILVFNIHLLKNNNFNTKLLFAIFITLVITQVPRYAIFILIEIFLVSIFYLILYRRTLCSIINMAKSYAFVLVLLLAINAYWLAPTIFAVISSEAPSPSYLVTYDSVKMFSAAFNMYDILTLTAVWVGYLELNLSIFNIDFSFLIVILPLLAFTAVLFWKRASKDELFLLLIGSMLVVIGAFLSLGFNTPTSSLVYSPLVFSTPGYISWMFRVPGHFLALIAFGYVINTSVILCQVIEIKKSVLLRFRALRISINTFKISFLLGVILITGIICWQRFTGDLDGVLENGYHPQQADYFSRIPYQRAIILLDDYYAGNFQPSQMGKAYINTPKDLNQYLIDTIKGKNINGLLDTMRVLGSDAIVTNLELPSSYSKYFSKFTIPTFGVAIYMLQSQAQRVYVPSVVMETENMKRTYLDSFGSDELHNSSVTVIDSEIVGLSKRIINPENSSITVNNANGDMNIIIKPFNYATRVLPDKYWSKAASTDPLHGPWHPYLETTLGIKNWQTDGGYGIVYTNSNDTLNVPFEIREPGTYDLFVRYLANKDGGLMGFAVNSSNIADLPTKSPQSRFVWKDIGSVQLNQGKHWLSVSNLRGFNAINIVEIVPSEMQKDRVPVPNNKLPMYVFEAESDLIPKQREKSKQLGVGPVVSTSGHFLTPEEAKKQFFGIKDGDGILNQTIDITRDGLYRYTTQSPVIARPSDHFLTPEEAKKQFFGIKDGDGNGPQTRLLNQTIDITRDGLYRFTTQSPVNAVLTIDNKSFTIKSSYNDTVNTPNFFLKKGNHHLQIEIIGAEGTRTIPWSFENNSTVREWSSLNGEFTVNNGSGIFDLWESVPRWKIIQFPFVSSNQEFEQSWNFGIKCHHCHGAHIKIVEYDSKKNVLGTSYLYNLAQEGDFDWKDIHLHYKPKSPNAAYTQLQIWHGFQTNMALPNQIWLRNASYTDSDRYLSDTVWLYLVEKPTQTLKDIISVPQHGEITEYEMVDPTHYKVRVKGTAPYMLAFTELYDPLWTASINGTEIRSIPLYSLINGFPIEISGESSVDIEYSPQEWLYYGLTISVVALIILTSYAIYRHMFPNLGSRHLKFLFNKFRRK